MSQAAKLSAAMRSAEWIQRTGRIVRSVGLTVESEGPDARLGEICEIAARGPSTRTLAEVVGFTEGRVLLMPYEDLVGIEVGSAVIASGETAHADAGEHLLGRVIDGFGVPLDGLPLQSTGNKYPLYRAPLNPLERGKVSDVLETGVRVIDTLLTMARGQRVGIFAGSGVGKSTVLGMIARQVRTDVSVIALVGERGREVRTFVDEGLSPEARAKSVVIAATSDQPPLVRRRAAFLATAIAEYFCDQGAHVCLTMDSVTRIAMAQREIGLASGELPTARGYTPSVFALLPRLLERGGVRASGGSLTGLYTVLVEGDDMSDPIADTVRSILDGHIVLSRAIAHRARYPAVDVTQSISRLTSSIVTESERRVIDDAVRTLALYESSRDLIEVGAYKPGANPQVDRAVKLVPELEKFIMQRTDEVESRAAAMGRLSTILERGRVTP
jgi:flagellum-specific ATP synthase